MSEGREEKLWQQSKDNYKAVQQGITTGLHLELFDDVPRLVPQHITPTADMRDVEQPEFNPDIIRETTEANRKKKGGKKAPKKAKKAKTMREVPENALTSFVKASALKKGKAKTKASSGARRGEGSSRIHGSGASATASSDSDEPDEPPPKALALSDDSDDEMLARGLRPPSPKARAPAKKLASSPALSEAAGSAQRGSAAGTPDSSRPRGRKLGMGVRRMPSSFVPASEVRRATTSAMGPPQSTSRPAPQRKASLPEGRRGGSDSDTDDSDIEFLPGPPPAKAVAPRPRSPSPVLQAKRKPHPLVAALAASAEQDGPEDDELDAALAEHEMLGHDEADAAVSPPSADAHDSFDEFADEPDFDESVLAGLEQLSAARKQGTAPAPQSSRRSLLRHEGAVSPGSPLADKRSIASRIASSARLSAAGPSRKATPASPEESPFVPRVRRFVRSPRRSSPAEDDDEAMPPPLARPVRRFRRAIEDDESTGAAESSRAGAAGANGARGAVPAVIITAKRRADGAAEKRTKRAKRKRIGGSPTSRMLFRNSAERDTDEEVHGERDEDDEGLHTEDDADSSDREHVGDFEPTQAPRNVNMRAIYQQSLL
jgi:ATP-dependent DNA helicase MPH1